MSEARQAKDLLRTWLLRSGGEQAERLQRLLDEYRASPSRRALFRVLALAPRAVGTRPLELDAMDLAEAKAVCAGWQPEGWRHDRMARILVLLDAAEVLGSDDFHQELAYLFGAADVAELETLYRALILFPQPQRLLPQAMEGTRSNVTRVFTALAYENPFPASFFEEEAWNRMILKAAFLELPLAPIQGLDERTNSRLAELLLDYVRERWAARRPVRWDLWRCIGPAADLPANAGFFERLLQAGSVLEQQAGVLALCSNPSRHAAALCAPWSEWTQAVRGQRLTWHLLGDQEPVEPAAHLSGPL
jgi:hypothetical protein